MKKLFASLVLSLAAFSAAAQTNNYNILDRGSAAILPSSITVGASPFVFQNVAGNAVDVTVNGGTVTLIEVSRDGVNFFVVGLLSGQYTLSVNDRIRVTWTLAPTMTL